MVYHVSRDIQYLSEVYLYQQIENDISTYLLGASGNYFAKNFPKPPNPQTRRGLVSVFCCLRKFPQIPKHANTQSSPIHAMQTNRKSSWVLASQSFGVFLIFCFSFSTSSSSSSSSLLLLLLYFYFYFLSVSPRYSFYIG